LVKFCIAVCAEYVINEIFALSQRRYLAFNGIERGGYYFVSKHA